MITNDIKNVIESFWGNSEYIADEFFPGTSNNELIKICIGDSKYILKFYHNNDFFKTELDFMYLFMKNKCKVPSLVKYSSIDSSQPPWILYEYVEGISLNQVKSQLSSKTLKQVWKQVGKELKKIHSIPVWTDTEVEKNKSDFICRLKNDIVSYAYYIDKREKSLLLVDAISFLKNNFSCINKPIYGTILQEFDNRHIIIRQKKDKWILGALVDFERTSFGCLYIDIAGLYLNAFLDDQDLENSFWEGYDPERVNFEGHCIYFILLCMGLKLCTILREIDFSNYQWGLSIIDKSLDRIQKLN